MHGPRSAVGVIPSGEENTSVLKLVETVAAADSVSVAVFAGGKQPDYLDNLCRMAFMDLTTRW